MTSGIVIFARLDSRRMPAKALKPLHGRVLLGHVIDRCLKAAAGVPVIVATPQIEFHDVLNRFATHAGVLTFRGDADDVVGRALACAQAYGLDCLVRISGDSPFIDPALIEAAIAEFENGEWDIVTNVFPRTYPPGVSVEAIGVEALARVASLITDPEDREHVTRYIYRNPDRFRIRNLAAPDDRYAGVSLAVDTDEDAEKAAWIMANAGKPAADIALDEAVALARRWAEERP